MRSTGKADVPSAEVLNHKSLPLSELLLCALIQKNQLYQCYPELTQLSLRHMLV